MMAALSPTETGELTPLSLSTLPARPLVSILMANYNYAGYISQAIDSVIGQTYSNWELLICDDGSTDESVPVIERFTQADPRIQLVVSRNGGHGSALNAAYARAKGEIISLLDSDDLFLATKLERVVECCRNCTDCGFVIHRVVRVNQNRQKEGVWPLLQALPRGWYGARLLQDGGLLSFLPPTSGLTLRREVAGCLFPMPVKGPLFGCPDQVMTRLAPLVTSIGAVDEALTEYRLHSANTFAKSTITPASLEREMQLCDALWQQQYSFLSESNPRAAARLSPLETVPYVLFVRYLQAKLRNDPSAKTCHTEYMEAVRKEPPSLALRFWRFSFYIPGFLFGPAINLFLGQNAAKRLIARVRGLG